MKQTLKTYKQDALNRMAFDEMKKRLIAHDVAGYVETCASISAVGRLTQINWKMIRKDLELMFGVKLTALHIRFFSRRRTLRQKINGQTVISHVVPRVHATAYPKDYVAGIGARSATGGLCMPTFMGGIFTDQKMLHEDAKEEGVNGEITEYAKALVAGGVTPTPITNHRDTTKRLHG